jgi:formylglycine-generating enzyme required for sulfatase activity
MSNPPAAQLDTFAFETVRVDRNGEIVECSSGTATYLTEELTVGVSLDLVAIPGGSFMMGDRWHSDEQPLHEVTVPPFYLGKYPITQAQYRSIMGGNALADGAGDLPIERVNWHEAIAFCQKLSQQTGNHYSLPSEAQWEYACRANSNTPFCYGETITTDLVNYNGDYPFGGAPKGENRERVTPVGSFAPNAFGLYDLHGNVWEWCLDEYHPNYQGAPTDGSDWSESQTVATNQKRVMRGGAWDYVARGCRSAVRCSLDPNLRVAGCGFRVALSWI